MKIRKDEGEVTYDTEDLIRTINKKWERYMQETQEGENKERRESLFQSDKK